MIYRDLRFFDVLLVLACKSSNHAWDSGGLTIARDSSKALLGVADAFLFMTKVISGDSDEDLGDAWV